MNMQRVKCVRNTINMIFKTVKKLYGYAYRLEWLLYVTFNLCKITLEYRNKSFTPTILQRDSQQHLLWVVPVPAQDLEQRMQNLKQCLQSLKCLVYTSFCDIAKHASDILLNSTLFFYSGDISEILLGIFPISRIRDYHIVLRHL